MNSPDRVRGLTWVWRRVGLWLALLAGVSVLFFPIAKGAYKLSKAMYELEVENYTTTNKRGDELSVTTDTHAGAPYKTVVTLSRVHRWFSSALVTVTSTTLWVDLRWRDDDHAEISFSSDHNGKMEGAVGNIGAIQFKYSFEHKEESAVPHGYIIE